MIARTHLWISLLIVAATAALSLAYYPRLPDPSPIHWNLYGEADDFGSPVTLAVLAPAISAGTLLLLLLLPLAGPFRRNFESFRHTYGKICILMVAMFFVLHAITLLKAVGHSFSIGSAMAILVGGILTLLGNWFGKIRRNFYVGIRTPWTIANERVWEKTHRIGGPLTMAVGIASIISGLTAPDYVSFGVLIGGVVALVVWSIGYSLYWYRRLGSMDELPSTPSEG